MSRRQRLDLPEGPGNTVGPSNVGRLEESGSPSPLTDDDTGGETGLDHTSSGAERGGGKETEGGDK